LAFVCLRSRLRREIDCRTDHDCEPRLRGARALTLVGVVSAAAADAGEEGAPVCVTRVDCYFFVAGMRCAVGDGRRVR
jgi:hypothetical protein